MKIVVTGAAGLIGWHASVQLHAQICAARFQGQPDPLEFIALSHNDFQTPNSLQSALKGADAVLHFAGINRATDEEIETGNPDIANKLVDACKTVGCTPHVVYANSTHSASDTPYGRSKRIAGEILAAFAPRFTDLVLPHVFGECARPFYNNVTATLIQQTIGGEAPTLNPDGRVELLHAGDAAHAAISAVINETVGQITPDAMPIKVPDLFAKIQGFHANYLQNIFPDLSKPFDLALFNTYRAATYPDGWPRNLKLNTDVRGTLFEAAKGGGGGQTFVSTTAPGVTRGNHFHLNKVERFLVLAGNAIIRIRKALSDQVWEYRVSGDQPAPVDMPTLHTHSIENVGNTPLLTLFWTHDIFDPTNPDTFADKVLQ